MVKGKGQGAATYAENKQTEKPQMSSTGYWYPPAEYMSQRMQDLYEPTGGLQLPSTRPKSLEAELQHKLWDYGIWCDVSLVEKYRDDGKCISFARMRGPLREKLLARPIVKEWINNLRNKRNQSQRHD